MAQKASSLKQISRIQTKAIEGILASDKESAEKEWDEAQHHSIRILTLDDEDYPMLLKEIQINMALTQ